MRAAFKNLINTQTVKGAAGRSANSMDAPRNSADAVIKFAQQLFGGRYDKAAVDLITSNKWLPHLKNIKKIKDPRQKASGYVNLLSKIATVESTAPGESSGGDEK